ncbi:MAG TPA: FG-GAP repeat protein, partial [Planctomycetaceae bacterium]|nr:FG-GAP repeat protein [Planctomycetaceae bacterium]
MKRFSSALLITLATTLSIATSARSASMAPQNDSAIPRLSVDQLHPPDTRGFASTRKGASSIWFERQQLFPAWGSDSHQFGISVSISGDRMAVGAPYDNSVGDETGAVYLFEFDGLQWTFADKLIGLDAAPFRQFGRAVDISGERLVVGAPFDDEAYPNAGAVYVFDLIAGSWTETAKLLAPDNSIQQGRSDQFGWSVSLSGNRTLVGKPGDDHTNAGGASVWDSGSAYIFGFDGMSWGLETKITPSSRSVGANFGISVSLITDRVMIGAPGESFDLLTGGVYIFDHDGVSWSQTLRIPSFVASGFGHEVSLSDNWAFAGVNDGASEQVLVSQFDGSS